MISSCRGSVHRYRNCWRRSKGRTSSTGKSRIVRKRMGIGRRGKAKLKNHVELGREKYKVTRRTLEVRGEFGTLGGTGGYVRLEPFRELETLEDVEARNCREITPNDTFGRERR